MQILNPQLWWLAFLAVFPIALYLFRRRSKTIPVSSLVFFKSLAREHQESEWLRRLKRIISLILTLLLLSAAVLALVRMVFSPVNGDTRNVVILLDRSASMQAVDKRGTTRLHAAKAEIRNRLEGLNQSVGVSLIAYDARPEILQPNTLKRRALLTALETVQVRPIAQNPDTALEAADILAKLESPSEIWHVTDDVNALAHNSDPRVVPVPVDLKECVNAGITAFQIRKIPLQSSRYTAYFQVSCNDAAPAPVRGRIEVRAGGVYLSPRQFELEPGESAGFEIPIDGVADQLLQLNLKAENDCLELDNSILVPLPRSRPILAARIGRDDTIDPFTQLALQSLVKDGDLQIWSAPPERWPLKDIDVAIFDSWLPEEWPSGIPVIAINPPHSLGPIHALSLPNGGIPHRNIRVTNDDHPVVYRIAGSRLALTQTCILDAMGSFEPLWLADNEPVLAAGTFAGQRIVVMGFAPQTSERLPLTASFPLLMGNAIYWCAEDRYQNSSTLQERRTGDVVNVSGTKTSWTELRDAKLVSNSYPLTQELLSLERSGVWKTDGGQHGTAHLLSRTETNIRPLMSPEIAETTISQPSGRSIFGDPAWFFLALILIVLIAESLLFHWFSVY